MAGSLGHCKIGAVQAVIGRPLAYLLLACAVLAYGLLPSSPAVSFADRAELAFAGDDGRESEGYIAPTQAKESRSRLPSMEKLETAERALPPQEHALRPPFSRTGPAVSWHPQVAFPDEIAPVNAPRAPPAA